jgi:glycosidase
MKGFVRVVLYATGLALAGLPPACTAFYPSPADWRDENIYFIFTDRFNDGDPSNHNAESSTGAPYAPTNSRGINGGDFKGIEKKVDYLKSLGATAIWITPIPLNVGGSVYHGYGAQDFYKLAPHLGTLTDLSNMVSACHSRGIKVVLDIVVNHSGDIIGSSDSGYPNFKTPPAGYTMRYNGSTQHAPPFNITNAVPPSFTSIFHTNGVIQDFSNNTQVEKGELSNLDDFNTELTYVRTNMANIYKYWIQTGDLDGFRIDTVKHVDHGNGGFWNYWCPQIHNFATSIGKSNFFMFGEVYDGSDQKNGYYTGTMLSTNFALDATLDYPLYFMVGGIFASGTGNTKQIEDHYNAIATYYDPAAQYRFRRRQGFVFACQQVPHLAGTRRQALGAGPRFRLRWRGRRLFAKLHRETQNSAP